MKNPLRKPLKKFGNWLGLGKRSRSGGKSPAVVADGPWAARRWEGAETNRLNRAHWSRAIEQPINADLISDLATLRTRIGYEVARNPILEGVCKTFADDIAGEDGPTLKVRTKDTDYAKAFKAVWWDFFNRIDITGRLSGVDVIKLCARHLLDSGEYIGQKVTKPVDPGPISLRLKMIHPRRLNTPPAMHGSFDVVMGIKRTVEGQPLEYYFSEPSQMWGYLVDVGKFSTVPASDVIHGFATVEEDQARGVPWLAPALQTTADIRDLDNEVLDAVRAAADSAIVLSTTHADAQYLEVNEVAEIERRQMQTLPPGWQATQMTPEQPGVNFVEYRSDRMREVGRPIGMPLMMIRLGSEAHNFSSARFDNEVYKRGVRCVRRSMERDMLNGIVEEVQREAQLYAAANPQWKHSILARIPEDFDFKFIWPAMVAVDAEKDAQDQAARMKTGTLDYEEACARDNNDADEVLEKHREMISKFKAAGVPLPEPYQNWGGPDAALAKQLAASKFSSNAPGQNGNGNRMAVN